MATVTDLFPRLFAVHTDGADAPAHLFRPAAYVAMCEAPFHSGGSGEQDVERLCGACIAYAAMRGLVTITVAFEEPDEGFGTGYDDDRPEGSIRDYDASDAADRLRAWWGEENGARDW